jgi:MYXO-CTERM domain-containing protein
MSGTLRFSVTTTTLCGALLAITSAAAEANLLVDGSFENQAVLQSNPFYTQPDGSKWGAAWSNWGWSSWQSNFSGAWVGGAIARTEDYTTGWKWAHTGDVFGIIKDRNTMSQTFTATEDAIGTLSWFDANRSSWRENTWFGRQNNYSVTVTDSNGNVQTIGSYTSEVYLGLESNSEQNIGDDRFTLAGKQGWFAKTGASFVLEAGMTYTLSFNSLSPYITDANGNITGVDDRTTLLDDISLTTSPIPTPGAMALLGLGALVGGRRRR